jgi:saccharopine dehydrogenase (NAD+, L-lysine-forming)
MKIGIRAEDKSPWEARMPLVPEHVARLRTEHGVDLVVQPSAQRAFSAEELAAAGIPLQADLTDCDVVLGVKEIPPDLLLPGRTYVFFSHTIKGQTYNMDMLRRLMAEGCNLIDYECIVDDEDRRLVFFGVHAGLAGMIDTLWALGQRLLQEGLRTPLAELKQAVKYRDLASAKDAVRAAGAACRGSDAMKAAGPVVLGITGNGRVSHGAQEICALLEPTVLTPAELLAGGASEAGGLYLVVFEEEDMATPLDPAEAFERQTYYTQPERYRGAFARFHPHLSALVNCIFWTPKYPRLVTKADLAALYAPGAQPRLKVIGDISCDIHGSIEATVKAVDPGHPVYVWDVEAEAARDGFEGRGPVIMAVEILPTEIPREASGVFSEALVDLIPGLAQSDPSGPRFEDWALPGPLARAVILHHGKLTPRFAYMQKFVE